MDRTPSFQVQQFGNYFLLDRIAVGGMAEIFKAKQVGARGFEKIVVIKKILQHLSEDPEFVSMFEDEAKIAAQLNHANIVQIYELGEVGDTLYITMEFVEGRNLRDLTRAISGRGMHLSISQSVFIMTEVLKGLDFAHRKKDSVGRDLEIIHRDMSPQNIIISFEGEVKVLDFGIAKASSKISKTEAGVLKGKFSYMSPEQASGQPVDQSTDIYACGVILYELLTSSRLFKAETDIETLERVRMGLVSPPSEKNSDIPKELDQIVLRALKRAPEKRYQSAGEMLRDLNQFAFSYGQAYDSQELSAFVQTLFKDSIEFDREKLQAALAKVANFPTEQPDPARTHIAFKAADFPTIELIEKNKNRKIEQTSAPKGKSATGNFRKLFIAILFLGSLISYLWMSTNQKRINNPSAQTTPKETDTSQRPQVPEVAPEQNPSKGGNEPAIQTPATNPQPELPQAGTPTEQPSQSENESPKIETVFKDVVPPAEAPNQEEAQKQTRVPPVKILAKGRVQVIAPESGYAELFVNGKSRGYIPDLKVANFELIANRSYEFKCVSESKTFTGNVRILPSRLNLIDCQKLE